MSDVVSISRLNKHQVGVLAACSLLMAIDGYDVVAYGTVLPMVMSEWDMDPVTAGGLGSLTLVAMLLGGLFISPLADKFGRRPLLITCLAVASTGSFLCAFTTGPGQMGAVRFVIGLALGALVPNMLSLVGEVSPLRFRALFVSTVSAFYCLGGVTAALTSIGVEQSWGWQGVFYLAGLPLLLIPVYIRWLPESPEFLAAQGRTHQLQRTLAKIAPGVDSSTVTASNVSNASNASNAQANKLRQLVTNGNTVKTVLIWVFFAMCMLLSYGLNTWLPKLMQAAGYPLSSALWTLVTLNAGGFVGSIAGGWIAGRTSYRSTLVAYFSLAVIALVGLSFNPGTALINLFLFLAGAASIGTLALVHAFAVEYYPASVRSIGVGWAAGIGRLGAIAGPTLGGALLALDLSFQKNFLLVAIPGIIGVIAVSAAAQSRFRETTAPPPRI
ncbi:MFS transporter [Rhodococcus pyridinivorans]